MQPEEGNESVSDDLGPTSALRPARRWWREAAGSVYVCMHPRCNGDRQGEMQPSAARRPRPVCSMWPVWEKCIDVNVWKQWRIIPLFFYFGPLFCCCSCSCCWYYCYWTFIFSGYKILHSFLYTFSLLTCYLFLYCFALFFRVQFLLFKMENGKMNSHSLWLFCVPRDLCNEESAYSNLMVFQDHTFF